MEVKHVKSIVTISGIYYTDFHTALLEQGGCPGWHYVINRAMGKPQDKILKLINKEVTSMVCECALQPLDYAEVAGCRD